MPEAPFKSETKPSEIVRVNQEFPLFDPKRVESHHLSKPLHGRELDVFDSIIVLETGISPTLVLRVATLYRGADKISAFTPFDPTDGYKVTEADYDPQARAIKIRALRSEQGYTRERGYALSEGDRIDVDKTPLQLEIEDQNSWYSSFRAHIDHYNYEQLNRRDLDKLVKRLRLRLSFPNGITYEGIPWIREEFDENEYVRTGQKQYEEPRLIVSLFYPSDKGPFPASERLLMDPGEIGRSGLMLFLPSDLNLLRQIKAKFVVLPNHV